MSGLSALSLRLRRQPFCLPAFCPALVHGIHDVLGVAEDGNLAGLLQRLQALDDGKQFHAIIRSLAEAAAKLLAVLAVLQDSAVSTRTGIA